MKVGCMVGSFQFPDMSDTKDVADFVDFQSCRKDVCDCIGEKIKSLFSTPEDLQKEIDRLSGALVRNPDVVEATNDCLLLCDKIELIIKDISTKE